MKEKNPINVIGQTIDKQAGAELGQAQPKLLLWLIEQTSSGTKA